jgi:hypothetical protein
LHSFLLFATRTPSIRLPPKENKPVDHDHLHASYDAARGVGPSRFYSTEFGKSASNVVPKASEVFSAEGGPGQTASHSGTGSAANLPGSSTTPPTQSHAIPDSPAPRKSKFSNAVNSVMNLRRFTKGDKGSQADPEFVPVTRGTYTKDELSKPLPP